jgi:hypothetical protein
MDKMALCLPSHAKFVTKRFKFTRLMFEREVGYVAEQFVAIVGWRKETGRTCLEGSGRGLLRRNLAGSGRVVKPMTDTVG